MSFVEQIESPTRIAEDAAGDVPLFPTSPRRQAGESGQAQSPTVVSYFDSLPPEIISIIANALDGEVESLKAFRNVNRICSSICTRLLFQKVNVLINTQGLKHLHCILGNPDIRHAVTSITINTAEYTDKHVDTFDWDDRDGELLKRFNHYLSRLGRFHNLRSVHFKFSKSCVGPPFRRYWWASQVPESVVFRLEALQNLFKGLNDPNNPTPKFHSLTLENLQDVSDSALVDSSDFKNVMRRIDRLEMQIATEHDEGSPMSFIEKKELHDFFTTQLTRDWLSLCAPNLTYFKLYASSAYWGYVPRCSLPHFPRLKSLSFGKMTFSHDSQLEWLLSHSETLQELTLDDCPIIIGTCWFGALDADNYPLDTSKTITSETASTFHYSGRWHTYFRAFRQQLHQLRALRCGFDDRDWENAVAFSRSHTLQPRLWAERYRVFDTCWLERPPFATFSPEGEIERGEYDGTWQEAPHYPHCTDEDLTELVRLREVLCKRTGVDDEELAMLQKMLF